MRATTKARTREALLAAAVDAFRDDGVDGASLDAICARAGFTRGAFYVHFGDREALVVAVVEAIVSRWTAQVVVSADAGGDLDRSVAGFAREVGALGSGDLRLVLEAAHRHVAVRQRFLELAKGAEALLASQLRAAQVAGRASAELDAEASGAGLVALAIGLVALTELGATGSNQVGSVADTVRSGWLGTGVRGP